jgi:hypothetical protein
MTIRWPTTIIAFFSVGISATSTTFMGGLSQVPRARRQMQLGKLRGLSEPPSLRGSAWIMHQVQDHMVYR